MNLSFPLLSRLHPLSSHPPSSCSSRAVSSAPLSSGLDFPTAMQTVQPLARRPPAFGPNTTRWEKEKLAAAGSLDHDEPRRLGMWVFGETVGKGASGRVRIVQHLRTGRIAAAKIIPMEFIKQSRINIDSLTDKAAKQKLSIEREVLMMKLMDHPNIMRLYDVYEGDDECVMILEFVDGGELFDFLVNKRRLLVPEALNYFRQIISGLNYCHTHHIIHRDLKPENILLTGERLETIKIADWGMATLQSPECMLQTSCGSPHYASPEIVCGKHYEGAPSDIWSCGVILFALLSGRLPFDDKDIHVLLRKVKHGQYEMSPQIAHPAAIDLIRRMLIVNPTDRIAMDEILSHPFMHLDAPEITPMLRQPTRISDKESQEAISHIDRDLFRSMCAILRTQIDADEVLAALTQPGRHHLKTIYRLLVQYRNRSMEEYNMTEDYDHCDPSARQHIGPLIEASAPRPARKHRSSQNRASVVNGPRPTRNAPQVPGMLSPPPTDLIPQSPVAASSTAPSPVPTSKPTSHRPLSPPPTDTIEQHASLRNDRPCRKPESALVLPCTPHVATEPAQTEPSIALRLGRTQSTRPAGPRPLKVDLTNIRRSTQPDVKRSNEPLPAAVIPSGNVSSWGHARSSDFENSPVMGFRDDSTPPAPAQAVAALGFVLPPTTAESQLPVIMNNIEHANPLATIHNENEGKRPFSRYQSAPEPSNRRDPDLALSTGEKENLQPSRTQVSPAHAALPKRHKTDDMPGAYHTNRRSNVPASKPLTPVFTQDRADGLAVPQADDHGPDVWPAIAAASKRKSSAMHWAPPPASTSLGMEFRGWFANLFNQWKPQPYILHANENSMVTVGEITRILEEFKVRVVQQDMQDPWPVLICKRDKVEDGTEATKQVRFRIETAPAVTAGYMTTLTMVLEKGAFSAFKAAHQYTRERWTLDQRPPRHSSDAWTSSNKVALGE